MFSKSCAKIGERNINVKTFGRERNRISIILCISASGLKLPPLIIFKDQPNGRIEKVLSINIHVKLKNYMNYVNLINGLIKIFYLLVK